MLSLGLKIAMYIIMAVQLLAIGYAAHLIRRTKYNIIWTLCIVGLAISFAMHLLLLYSPEVFNYEAFFLLDVVASLCIVVAVLFAHRLVTYIDRLNYQRSLFSKRLLSAVLRTEERSRSQFAKELHDGMGPLLSSAKMSLSAISAENMSKEQQNILNNTRFVIDEAIRSVREISNNMSPQILIDFGLAQGLHNFLSRIQSLHTIEIVFNTNLRKERFDNDIEVVLYRVICELVNNSLKHSGCSKIEISLMLRGGYLQLHYDDNGCGFNPDKVIASGMGLSNITSRVDSLNGELQITSAEGRGVHVFANINTSQSDSHTPKQRRRRWKKR
ncbi:MAG: sensor histidine kinase [Rikenellaceae bacterium]|nr:sensor histidine kinase [Rikenellaceae bacterium]